MTKGALNPVLYEEAWALYESQFGVRPKGRGLTWAEAKQDQRTRASSGRRGYKSHVGTDQLVPGLGGLPLLSGSQVVPWATDVPDGVTRVDAQLMGSVPIVTSCDAAESRQGAIGMQADSGEEAGHQNVSEVRPDGRPGGESSESRGRIEQSKRTRKQQPKRKEEQIKQGWQRGRWRVTATGTEGRCQPAEMRRHARELFLFEDNEADRQRQGAPQESQDGIRGCENAAGVRIGYGRGDGYCDRTLTANKESMRQDIEAATARVMSGAFDGMVLPGDGLGGEELRVRAPHTYSALRSLLDNAQRALASWDGAPQGEVAAAAWVQECASDADSETESPRAKAPRAADIPTQAADADEQMGDCDSEDQEDARMEERGTTRESADAAGGEDACMEDWELDNLRAEYGQLYCTAWDAISDNMLRAWLADPDRLLMDGDAVCGGKRDENGEPAPRRQWRSLQQMLRTGQLAVRPVPGDGACAIWAALAGEMDAASGGPVYPEIIAMCDAAGPRDVTPEGTAKEFMRGLRRKMSLWWQHEEQRDAAMACEEFCPTWEEWATRTINELGQCDMRREIWNEVGAQSGEMLGEADLVRATHWLRTKAHAGHVQAAQWLTKVERSTFDETSTPSAMGDDRRMVRAWLRNIEGDKEWVSAAHLRSMSAALGRESGRMLPMVVVDSDSLSDLVWFCDSDGGPIVMRSWQETVLRCPNMLVLVWNGRDHFDGTQPL